MPAAGPLTLLHVSDMQFGRNHAFQTPPDEPPNQFDTLLERLWTDVHHLRENDGLNPDLLICTGDLAEWAWPKEFTDATGFLGELAKRLGLSRERVILIPGNHDVHRRDCLASFHEAAEGGEPVAAPWYAKWRKFERAFTDFYAGGPAYTFRPAQPYTLFRIPELEVVVAGLNSTWVEGHDWPADGSLDTLKAKHPVAHAGECGEGQLRWFATELAHPDYRGWLRLGAVHHNFERGARVDNENLRDAERLKKFLGPHLHLLLHGHTHRARWGWCEDLFPWFATGSAGLQPVARPDGVSNQYQFLTLDPAGAHLRARSYLPAEERWADDPSFGAADQPGRKTVVIPWRAVQRFPVPGANSPTAREAAADATTNAHGAYLFGQVHLYKDFLGQLAVCCALRFHGAQIEQHRPPGATPFLHVACQHDGFPQLFPVGATLQMPGLETLHRFATEVVAQYRAASPNTPAFFVYGGAHYAGAALRQGAADLRIRLQSFDEFQGLIDFRPYLARQNGRLAEDPVYPPHLYVPQRMDFEAGTDRDFTADALTQILTWLSEPDPRFILLLGDFGTGKTFLMRELARELGGREGAPVPLLIELRALEKAQQLDPLLAAHFARHDFARLDLPALRYMMKQGRVVLLFDGFDELALRVGYDKAADHLDTLIQAAAGDARVIVTSRTSHFQNDQQVRGVLGKHVERLSGLRYCQLRNFDERQIRVFLLKRFNTEAAADRWLRLLTDVKDLLGLGENPRMLSFICKLLPEQLEAARARTGTISAADLYRLLFIEHWFGYEIARYGQPGVPLLLTAEQWLDPAGALALQLWTRVSRWLVPEELHFAVNAALERHAPDQLARADEATHALGSGTLFIRDEEGRFTFVHQSVMEWLVARRIAEELVADNASALLEAAKLSLLMADFLLDLAVRPVVRWRDAVLLAASPVNPLAKSNALLLVTRHVERLDAAVRSGGEDARKQAKEEQDHWLFDMEVAAGPNLRESQLQGEDLTKTSLRNANLRGANLSRALLRGCDLSGADLTDANLEGAICDRANFSRAVLSQVRADGCSALCADFTDADLSVSSWRKARLLGADLDDSQQAGMDLRGAALGGAETLRAHNREVPLVSVVADWNADGTRLAIGCKDGMVRIHNLRTGDMDAYFRASVLDVRALAWSPDGQRLAIGSEDHKVWLWAIDGGKERQLMAEHHAGVCSLAWSPDGKRLASGSTLGVVELWTEGQHTAQEVLPVGAGPVWSMTWSRDGRRLAMAGDDRKVTIVGVFDHQLDLIHGIHRDAVLAVRMAPNDRWLASASADGQVCVWDTHEGRERFKINERAGAVWAVAWSPDGRWLASGAADGAVRIRDRAEGALQGISPAGWGSINDLEWHQGGAGLLSSGAGSAVHVWDPALLMAKPARGPFHKLVPPPNQDINPLRASFLITADGFLAIRADGRFRFGGGAANQPLLRAEDCYFTPAEVADFFPERVLAADEPLLPNLNSAAT